MDFKNDSLPMGWELITVGEVAELYRGISYKKGESSGSPRKGYIPILRANNINEGLNFENLVYVPPHLVDENQLIKSGDIIFAMSSGSKHLVGKSAISNSEYRGSFGVFCGLLRPCEAISSKFLAYFFQSNDFRKRVSEVSKGTNINNLKREHVLDCFIPFPPTEEQHRIVAKIEELFSKLDKGVENLITAREQLKVYRQALLKHAFEGKLTEQWRAEHTNQLETANQLLTRIKIERENRYQEQLAEWKKAISEWEMSGKKVGRPSKPKNLKLIHQLSQEEIEQLPVLPKTWSWTTLGELVSGKERSMQSGPFGSNLKHSEFTSQGVLVLGIDNVLDGKFSLGNQNRITQKKFTELKKYQARPRDLLVTVMASLGRTCVVPDSIEDAIITKHVYRITMDENLLSTYFYNLLLQSHNITRKMMFENAQGQTRPGLNSDILRELPVPLCSIREQNEIINLIDVKLIELDRIEDSVKSEIIKTKAVRQSILKKAFTGELVTQSPNDEPASKLLAIIKAEREATQKEKKKQPHKTRKKTEVITMADLMEVIRTSKDWVSARDAFRLCGISDEAETDAIEKIYQELRDHEEQGKIAVERRGDEDWLRMVQEA